MLHDLLTSDFLYRGFIATLYLFPMFGICYITKWFAELSMRWLFPALFIFGFAGLYFLEFLAKIFKFQF
jgi:hypothetical protein